MFFLGLLSGIGVIAPNLTVFILDRKSQRKYKQELNNKIDSLMKYAFMAGGYYSAKKYDPEDGWEEFKKTNDGKKE